MTRDAGWLSSTLRSEGFRELARAARADDGAVATTGLVDGAAALFAALLGTELDRPVAITVPDDTRLDGWRRDLAALAQLGATRASDPRRVVRIPALDCDPYDGIGAHPEVVRERVRALERIASNRVDIVLVPARAYLEWLPDPGSWRKAVRVLRTGDELAPDRFVLEVLGLGYRRVDTVSAPGEVSRRGGILDVFPPGAEEPVRIELFGDTVDSLRAFDTDHQRSTGTLDEIAIGPAAENPPTDAAIARLAAHLEAERPTDAQDVDIAREMRRTIETLTEEGHLPGFEALAALTVERPSTLFDHLEGLLQVVDDPGGCDEAIARAGHDARIAWENAQDRVLPSPERLRVAPAVAIERLAASPLAFVELAGEEPEGRPRQFRMSSRSARTYNGRIAEMVGGLREGLARGGTVMCVLRGAGGAERLGEILDEYDVPVGESGDGVRIRVGGLRSGFELPDARLTVFTERDLFGEARKPAQRKKSSREAFVSDFRDLKPGDLVVHVDHGVARYAGLGRPKGGSLNRDFAVLEFSGRDKLFVPADRLDLLQKYSGVAGAKPTLDKLGGPGWNRVKARVRKSVESMAAELLELYAKRKATRGHPFPPDPPWQREMEESFPFELTDDQDRALRDVKSDMESERAMERLLVGDVGFGKTEIAIRAAFKAVLDGRQVALLAPTTVLVHQHAETFRRRFAAFPVRVEAISRFRSPADVRGVVEAVASGEVDVAIGTHRLLSKDVRFRKLGLLVVDEEQRFGVAHKERLKRMAVGVDVLSLTATPIPRTLQMSLAGVRDLSLIETPPPGRTAIQTYVVPWRPGVVAQAIRQEIRREGQVFVVHDRVETLPALVETLRELVPDARIVAAHGQMGERRLERVMLDFVEYRADVLVTTTIIENGLDIPRANTILVHRADRFGLAQLYQLRGRVGRSERHAYAYFLVPSREHLSDVARRRLRALQEFSDLGAGFRLAAADLEIRGAGELLGSRQHGHIASLGFDLYCQMLERAVRERQGEAIEERPPVQLHLGVDVKIPERYLPEPGDRLSIYKRLAGFESVAEVDRLEADVEDRHGQLPAPVGNLFAMTRLRVLAQDLGATHVDVADGRLQIRLSDDARVDAEEIAGMVRRDEARLTPSGMLIVPAPTRAADRIEAVRAMLLRVARPPEAAGGEPSNLDA